jgi:hypothetical protein
MKPVVLSASLTLSNHAKKAMGGGFEKRERLPNEALPNVINKMDGKYVPTPMGSQRVGANDFKTIASRGDRC